MVKGPTTTACKTLEYALSLTPTVPTPSPASNTQQMPANRSVLASGSADGTVMMWDVRATAKGPSYTLRGHKDRVTGLLASGRSVYSCSEVCVCVCVECIFVGMFVVSCRCRRLNVR